jgi:hypothetical protein
MVQRQGGCGFRVVEGDVQVLESLFGNNRDQAGRGIELADGAFDTDLPDGCGADEALDFGVGDALAHPSRQLGVVGKPPEQRMGVE